MLLNLYLFIFHYFRKVTTRDIFMFRILRISTWPHLETMNFFFSTIKGSKCKIK